MRIRIYSPTFPWPSIEGAHQVIADQVLSLLTLGHQVELVVWQARKSGVEAAPKLFQEKGQLTYLIREVLPESRFQRLMRVVFGIFSQRAGPEDFYYPLHLLTPWRQQTLAVDLAIYHYSFSYNWLSQIGRPQEKKVWIVQHNHEAELFELRAERETNVLAKRIHLLNAKKLREHEENLHSVCDEIVFISREDLRRFEAREKLSGASMARTKFLPPGFEVSLYERRQKEFTAFEARSNRLTLGFIGGMNFDPNRDSVLWILDKLCPQLAASSFEGRILIGGKSPTTEIQTKAAKFPFVELIGFVPEADRFWEQLHFNLIPHVSGSGVRLKLLEGLASGCPTLTTEAGASRIHEGLLKHPLLLVSDDLDEWGEFICNPANRNLRTKHQSASLHVLLNGVEIHSGI